MCIKKSHVVALLRKLYLHLCQHLVWKTSMSLEQSSWPCFLDFVSQCNVFSVYKQIPFSERKLVFDSTYWVGTRIVSIAEVQVGGILKCLWCGMSSLVSALQMCCSCSAPLAAGDPARGVWLACSYRLHKRWSVTHFCSEGLCKCLNIKGKKESGAEGKRYSGLS